MAERALTHHKPEEKEPELFDPLRELRASPLGSLMEDLFAMPRIAFPALPKAWMPRADVQETDKEYILSLALPGVKKEDVRIDVKDGVLTVSGEHRTEKEEKGKTWLRREMSCGSFQRGFTLPEGMHPEDVKAGMKDGVLTLTMPKPAHEKKRGVTVKID